MRTFKQYLAESYASKKDVNAVKKAIKPFIAGRMESGNGAYRCRFEEKNFDNVIQALTNALGQSILHDGSHRFTAPDGASVYVNIPSMKYPAKYKVITIFDE